MSQGGRVSLYFIYLDRVAFYAAKKVPPAPCSPDSHQLPCSSTSTVPAHTVRTARALNSNGDSNHSQLHHDLQSSFPSLQKSQTETFPIRNPTKPKINNKTQQQQQQSKGEKNTNRQSKGRVSIELSSIQKHLSGKKKVGIEAVWGQSVILEKESEELYLLLSLLKHLLSLCIFSVTYTKKPILQKYLKYAPLYLEFSVQSRGSVSKRNQNIKIKIEQNRIEYLMPPKSTLLQDQHTFSYQSPIFPQRRKVQVAYIQRAAPECIFSNSLHYFAVSWGKLFGRMLSV